MRRRTAVILLVALAVCTPLLAEDLETTAKRIEGKLMAPCCGANPLSDHFSRPAEEMKAEIRMMLAQGRSEREIIDFYVAKLGEKILAAPPARGFNLFAWFGGLLVLIAGSAIVVVWIRRAGSRQAAAATEATPVAEVSPEDAARVERALREMD